MQIKGSSLKATFDFVKQNYSSKVDLWLKALPENSRKLFEEPIFLTKWYPFEEGLKIPTEVLGRLFFSEDTTLASYSLGRYSAEQGLKGVYKIFIRITNPQFILKKLPSIFHTYYDFGVAENLLIEKNKGIYKIYKIPSNGEVLFPRIKGWTEKTLEIIQRKPININYNISTAEDGTLEALYTVHWD